MTRLCVPIFVRDVAVARRDMALAAEAGADCVELRIDALRDPDVLPGLLAQRMLPVIVTCRPTWEGGASEASDSHRVNLLTRAAELGAEFVDLELKAINRDEDGKTRRLLELTAGGQSKLIVSSHDFEDRPGRLYNTLMEMDEVAAEVNKIAWSARTIRDNLEIFELLRHRDRPTIALCMGEAGLLSRVLAKKFGAFLTFASLDADSITAPGQITIKEMKTLYRWDAIGPETRVYGVVANPARHSMSPAIHNAAFGEVGFDGVYLPMLVEGSYESFKAFMESFVPLPELHLCGLSITIPHKENALRYLREKGAVVEDLAARIGTVNTIVINRTDQRVSLQGLNTDYAAILDSITGAMGIDRTGLMGRRVAVLGAGGTGRTAVAALAHHGADVWVTNRHRGRAEALAAEFDGHAGRVKAVPMPELREANCEVWINTTSVGMFPNSNESPIGDGTPPFAAGTVVFDAVYNPIVTRLLTQAEAVGAKTIGGVEMFVRQAAAQFQAWTGRPAPRDVMRNVIQEQLRQRRA